MSSCSIIGTIRIPASVGQTIRINGKKCKEETLWTIAEVYGGESSVSIFTIENRSAITFPVSFEITPAIEGEYTAGVYLMDGVTPVSSPSLIAGKATEHFKLIIDFDKYIEEKEYEIIVIFDYV